MFKHTHASIASIQAKQSCYTKKMAVEKRPKSEHYAIHWRAAHWVSRHVAKWTMISYKYRQYAKPEDDAHGNCPFSSSSSSSSSCCCSRWLATTVNVSLATYTQKYTVLVSSLPTQTHLHCKRITFYCLQSINAKRIDHLCDVGTMVVCITRQSASIAYFRQNGAVWRTRHTIERAWVCVTSWYLQTVRATATWKILISPVNTVSWIFSQ